MELMDYVRILRAHWVGVVVLTCLGVLAAAAYNVHEPKVYQASATGFVTSGKTSNQTDASVGDTLAKSRVTSYVAIATSTRTAQDVINRLNLTDTPSALVGRVSVSQPTGTVLLTISARASTPQQAQRLADAWVHALAQQVAEIEGKPAPGETGLRMLPYTDAELPGAPVLPRTKLNLLVGLLLGALLGFGYALLRHQFDRRLRSTTEVERQFRLPVIGQVPDSAPLRRSGGTGAALAVTSADRGAASSAEAFRKLRTNLAYMDVDNPPRVIVVTSPKQGDGKSTVAANLAAAIAVAGRHVTLVDGDLRRPSVVETMEVAEGAGLTDVLIGEVTAGQVLQSHASIPGLSVLGSGRIPPNPSELLGSHSMRALLAELAQDGMVIVDAPPLLPVTDAAVLTRSADGAILVVSHGGTLDSELEAALRHIETVHGRTLGIVFNRMRKAASGGYADSEYYRDEYQPREGRRKATPRSGSSATPVKKERSGRH